MGLKEHQQDNGDNGKKGDKSSHSVEKTAAMLGAPGQKTGAPAEAAKQQSLPDISAVAMATRMEVAGLLTHPAVQQRITEVNASIGPLDEYSGKRYAAHVLAPVVDNHSAGNYLIRHLLESDHPPLLAAEDWIAVRKLGQGGMGGVHAVHTEGEIRIRKVSSYPNNRSSTSKSILERFDREIAINQKLNGYGVPVMLGEGTVRDRDGNEYPYFEYECKPRRSLGQLNDAFWDMDASFIATRTHLSAFEPTQTCLAPGDLEPSSAENESIEQSEETDAEDTATPDTTSVAIGTRYPRWFVDRIGAEVALRFTHFHENNIVHRDLKPGNIMITDDGLVEVIDFGLADDEELKSITHTQDVFGSTAYMSPEQLTSGKNTSPKSDVWSLGVILYEMYVGRRPFKGEKVGEIVQSISRLDVDFSCIDDEELGCMLKSMLEADHRLRPSMKEVTEFFFNRCGDLKQGFTFDEFIQNPLDRHRIPMPQQTGEAEVDDVIGGVLSESDDSEVVLKEKLGSLSKTPIECGIPHVTVLESILSLYPDQECLEVLQPKEQPAEPDAQATELDLEPAGRLSKSAIRALFLAGAITIASIGAGVWAFVIKPKQRLKAFEESLGGLVALLEEEDSIDQKQQRLRVETIEKAIQDLNSKFLGVSSQVQSNAVFQLRQATDEYKVTMKDDNENPEIVLDRGTWLKRYPLTVLQMDSEESSKVLETADKGRFVFDKNGVLLRKEQMFNTEPDLTKPGKRSYGPSRQKANKNVQVDYVFVPQKSVRHFVRGVVGFRGLLSEKRFNKSQVNWAISYGTDHVVTVITFGQERDLYMFLDSEAGTWTTYASIEDLFNDLNARPILQEITKVDVDSQFVDGKPDDDKLTEGEQGDLQTAVDTFNNFKTEILELGNGKGLKSSDESPSQSRGSRQKSEPVKPQDQGNQKPDDANVNPRTSHFLKRTSREQVAAAARQNRGRQRAPRRM